MNKTVNEFKSQQDKALRILTRLKQFLEMGEENGVEMDTMLKEKLLNAINEVEVKKLRIALIGGFSEGKTSIAAAWMEKLDKSSMKITHEESSDEVKVYNVNNEIELIDTPGLFGFKEKYNEDSKSVEQYKEITKKYVSEAHLVLYVMNPVNPIKESHKEDLLWLFRTLNLLPRTIFVLSRFDEVADVEEEEEYHSEAEIKKENVLSRLRDLIDLTDSEALELPIVAVAANPFGMGIEEHWLSNLEQYKQLSHISLLQNKTEEKIKHSGGMVQLVNETKKSIIQDVLQKQLPEAKIIEDKINEEKERLDNIIVQMKNDINSLEPKIAEAKINLRNFAKEYFTDLILQVRGTSIETVDEFFEREIGKEGININTKIQNEFDSEIGAVSLELQKIETNFNAEVSSFNKTIRSYGKQGINYLSKSNVLNKDTVLVARDVINNGAKIVGLDLSKYLKFKPWGATKFAEGANGVLAILGLGIELWDSWKQSKKEEEFQKAIKAIKENFEKQRKELILLINSEEFIVRFFPTYIQLKEELDAINEDMVNMDKRQASFREWIKVGEIIDVEFSEIKKVL